MKPVNIIVALTLFFLASCDDEPSKGKGLEIIGVIIDEASQEPIENVEIIGFKGGVHHMIAGYTVQYGEPVSLGTTDKCGQFKIALPDSIKGWCSRSACDNTVVQLRLRRPDFGEQEIKIPFKPGMQTFTMKYAPIREGFFKLLYLVQSEDGKSVHIGWNIPSLEHGRFCGNSYCRYTSDGNVHIQRSDSTGYDRYVIPIEVNTDQMITDSDLPPHGIVTYESFTYLIAAGGHFGYVATIGRGSDTLFLIKPPVFPTLNHCN